MIHLGFHIELSNSHQNGGSFTYSTIFRTLHCLDDAILFIIEPAERFIRDLDMG